MNYFPDTGKGIAALRVVNVNMKLMLFTNDAAEDPETELADLTEATFTGYSQKTLTDTQWTGPTIEGSRAVVLYDDEPQTWTNSGSSQTIYGAAILNEDADLLIWMDKFPSPVVVGTGLTIQYQPRMTTRNEE